MSDLYHFNGADIWSLGERFAPHIQAFHLDAARGGKGLLQHFMAEAKRHTDSKIAARKDAAASFSTTAAFHLERDLEQSLNEVLREEYKPRNAFRLFPMDMSTQPGAQTVRGARIYDDGEAAWHLGGGQKISRVGVSKKEQNWPVRYAVTGFGYDIFERMASGFAGSNYTGELLRAAREVLADLLNYTFWFGNEDLGLFGVLSYPYLPTRTIATAFNDTSAPSDILAAVTDLCVFPQNNSGAKFYCDSLVTSPRVANYLMNRDRNAVSASDSSIGEVFLKRNPYIKSIEMAWELQGTAPGGLDYMLAYRKDRKGIELRGVGAPFNVMPPQDHGLDTIVPCWAGCGGVIMRDVGTNILGIVTPPTT